MSLIFPGRSLLAGLALLLVLPATGAAQPPPVSSWWRDLGIRDLTGAPLRPSGRWVVVVFITPECPLANVSIPGLNALAAEFAPRGFAWVGAYVDPTSDLASLRAHARDYAIGFATADDRAQRLARFAGATYTPEAVVFSDRGAVLYRGRIDDRVGDLGAERPAAVQQDLREVLSALLAGKPGPFAERPGYGCALPEPVRP